MTAQPRPALVMDPEEIRALMEDLGIDEVDARRIIAISRGYTDHRTEPPKDQGAPRQRRAATQRR